MIFYIELCLYLLYLMVPGWSDDLVKVDFDLTEQPLFLNNYIALSWPYFKLTVCSLDLTERWQDLFLKNVSKHAFTVPAHK